MNKKELSERDICTKFITPALRQAGWDELTQLREEVSFTKGRIIVRGKMVTRGKAKRADYILYYKPNIPLAVIEAKDNNCSVGDGLQQALEYAETLQLPFVFSSNGDGFVFHDRTAHERRRSKRNLPLDEFPSPADALGPIPRVEGAAAGSRAARPAGLLRRRQREGAALLPGQRRQRRRRGDRQRAEPAPAGHGDRHRQDLHGVPDHLAPLEGGPQEADPLPRRPQRARRPDDGERLPPVRFGDGEAEHRVQGDRARGRHRGRVADSPSTRSGASTRPTRSTWRSTRPSPGRKIARSCSGAVAGLLRPDRRRRVPPRQRGRGFGVARDPRLLLVAPRRSA